MSSEVELLKQHNAKALQELQSLGVIVEPINFILLRLDALQASLDQWQAAKVELLYEQALAGLLSPENIQAAKEEAARRKLLAK